MTDKSSDSNSLPGPSLPEKITFVWLLHHVPVTLWSTAITALIITFVFGYVAAKSPLIDPVIKPIIEKKFGWAEEDAKSIDRNFFEGKWVITSGTDQKLDNFTPKYTYTGVLEGKIERGRLILEGTITTNDARTNSHIPANWVYEGVINNNHVAGHFTYTNQISKGFGTAFIEFNYAGYGEMYLIVRYTRAKPGEQDVAAVRLSIKHQS